MARRVLSSAQTALVMFGAPALFLVGAPLVAAILHLAVFSRLLPFWVEPLRRVGAEPYFWILWTGITLFQLWWGLRLKRVAVDDQRIYISDYFDEVALPLAAIQEVRENRWLRSHPVTIELFSDTPWGTTIRFMPKIRIFVPGFISHPVVAELRELAFAAQVTQRAAPIPGDAAGFQKPARGFGVPD